MEGRVGTVSRWPVVDKHDPLYAGRGPAVRSANGRVRRTTRRPTLLARRGKFVGFYGPAALKRDLWRIAKAEGKSLSVTVCGLLRLGLAYYFDLAGRDPAAERLRAQLEDVLAAED